MMLLADSCLRDLVTVMDLCIYHSRAQILFNVNLKVCSAKEEALMSCNFACNLATLKTPTVMLYMWRSNIDFVNVYISTKARAK